MTTTPTASEFSGHTAWSFMRVDPSGASGCPHPFAIWTNGPRFVQHDKSLVMHADDAQRIVDALAKVTALESALREFVARWDAGGFYEQGYDLIISKARALLTRRSAMPRKPRYTALPEAERRIEALEEALNDAVALLSRYRAYCGNTGWTCRDNRETACELYDESGPLITKAISLTNQEGAR